MEETIDKVTQPETNGIVLPEGWKFVLIEQDRLVYINEADKTWSWLPPAEAWKSRHSLSYGWEIAQSSDNRRYYINHLKKETCRSLPAQSDLNTTTTTMIPPRTRKVVISRHSDIGYGFVAGSEKPVLIRSVAEDGPSAGKLYANDQILKINEEDVGDMPQSAVIQRIKESSEELNLEVIASDDVQDVRNRGQRKSSIMSRTTREKRRSNPVSVRFADTPVLVQYVGSPPSYPFRRSSLPLIPNVLKIFLENGQTRSFLYNPTTVVKDLFASLADKIGLKKLDRFALVLQATQTLNDYIVQANERVSQVYTKRNCSSSAWLSKLLLIFAPKDVQKFWKEDPVAFDYFYRQMCSQVVEGRFGWELKYDIAIKLAALHLQQYAMEEKIGKGGKISVKAIEREVGSLENFVPTALINTMQKKDLQRILTQQIKQTRNLCPPGQKYISPLQAKLQYLKICSEMKTYGGKQFSAVVVDPTAEDQKFFQDQKVNSMIFVGPNVGLAHVTNPRSFTMQQIAEFSQINGLVITPHTEGKQNIKLFLNNSKSVTLIMGPIFETRDLVHLISGYHRHLVESNKPLSVIDMTCSDDVEEPVDEVPSYSDAHRVLRDDFSYRMDENDYEEEDVREISFRQKPTFEGNEMYSLADQCENTQHAASLSNGSVKTHLSIRVSNNQRLSLKSIEEEALSPRSPKNDDTGLLLSHSPEKPSYVNGIRELKRNSYLQLSDDLASESNDEGPSEKTETIIHEKQEATQVENIQLTDSTESLVRNHTSIHISSPSHKMKNVDTNVNSENLCNGDLTNNVHEVQDEIPLTPNLQSSSSNTSDDISSLSSSLGDDSPRTSPLTISNAISSNPKTSKEIISPSESKDNTLNTNVQAMVEHAMTDNYNEELPRNETENDKTENDSPTGNDKTENDSPTGNAQTNEFDETDGNRLDILSRSISKDPILQNGCLPSGMKANGDIKSFREKRRRSSGYISSYRDIRPNIHHIPECIIHDDVTLTVGQATEDDGNSQGHIKTRSDACDQTLKTFYSLKAKLTTLKHSNHSVRTSNEILRSKKQVMLDVIDRLEECIEKIKNLTSAEEINVVEAILITKSSLSNLTESCALMYNAQYSMKHFTSELEDSIDKHIDVLITTNAWSTTPVSDLTTELHKDKCDLVYDSLESLRKIISSL